MSGILGALGKVANFIPGVGPIIGAGIDMIAQHSANKTNVRMAQDQMNFQERMSNTAAQRSTADFKAANLNPALAYGTTASTPGGAMGRVEPVARGTASTAMSYLANKAQIAQTLANTENVRLQSEGQKTDNANKALQGDILTWQARNAQREFGRDFKGQSFPSQLAAAQYAAQLAQYGLAGARAQSNFYNSPLGKYAPAVSFGLGSAGQLAGTLRDLSIPSLLKGGLAKRSNATSAAADLGVPDDLIRSSAHELRRPR